MTAIESTSHWAILLRGKALEDHAQSCTTSFADEACYQLTGVGVCNGTTCLENK